MREIIISKDYKPLLNLQSTADTLNFLGILVVETGHNFSTKLNFVHVSTQKDFNSEEASPKGLHCIFSVPIGVLLG